MGGRIEFTMGVKTRHPQAKGGSGGGYRIYVLGNFSGRSEFAWPHRKIRRIDVDNFERVMAELAPSLEIGGAGVLQFRSTEEFHPDAWLKKVPILADLMQLKKDLANPNTADRAAAKINAFLPGQTPRETAVPTPASCESDEDTLERLLGRRPEPSVPKTDVADDIIRQAVAPHVRQDIELRHRDLIRVIEATLGEFMRSALHDANFRELEALWRAVEALVNEENSDEQAFFLVDISRAELSECQNAEPVFQQRLQEHVRTADGEQDVLLIGAYRFSDAADDLDLLAYCSRLAKACGACFLAGADEALIENIQACERRLGGLGANNLVLSYPRYLMRLPYGPKRDAVEAFAFEECSPVPHPSELLWGNPAFLCARSLMRSRQGQEPEQSGFFGDVPAFSFEQDGERILQPATEIVLNEAQANALAAHGIAPLIGFRQRQGIRLLPI